MSTVNKILAKNLYSGALPNYASPTSYTPYSVSLPTPEEFINKEDLYNGLGSLNTNMITGYTPHSVSIPRKQDLDFSNTTLGSGLHYLQNGGVQEIANNMYNQATKLGNGVVDTVSDVAQQSKKVFDELSAKGKLDTIGKTVGGVLNVYNAYKTNKLAKDQFNFQKDAYNKNYAAQRSMTNSQLYDRQKARVARDPNHYMSVDNYMNKYGVK